MADKFDVAVLGAGVVGVSTALHLQQRGRRVVLIDRRAPAEETSYGNSGIIESSSVLPYAFPSFAQVWSILRDRDTAARTDLRHLGKVLPFVLGLRRYTLGEGRMKTARAIRPLTANSLEEHRALMHAAGAADLLTERGWSKLFRTKAGFDGDAQTRKAMQECDIAFDVLDAAEFKSSLEPHIRGDFYRVVWLKDTATISNPGRLIKAYADSFAASGGAIALGDAKSLDRSAADEWRVQTSDGEVVASEAVVALGPWSMDLLRPLGYRYPLGIKRGYHRHYRPIGDAVLNRSVVDIEKGFLIAPMEQGYRITTGAEFTNRDATPSPVQLERVLPLARELFPLGEATESESWMGSRPCMPDSMPIVDRAARHQGLWLNFGHGHLGLTLGPVTGRLLAEMMTGAQTLCDPSPFSSKRFD
jgi:D-amino-acid dehydrogenase